MHRVIAGIFLSASARSVQVAEKPTELILLKNFGTCECDLLTIRKTQILRGASAPGHVHTSRLSAAPEVDRYSLVSYDIDALLDRAHAICGNDLGLDLWTPQPMGSQTVLAMGLPVEPPPLRIEPLVQSGSSHNRVDLVFFSDGCE